jgi:hypothetical protein
MKIDKNSKHRDTLRYGLRFAPTRLAYGSSRFCILKVTKPDDEHHLQVTRTASQTCCLHSRDFKSITTTNNSGYKQFACHGICRTPSRQVIVSQNILSTYKI